MIQPIWTPSEERIHQSLLWRFRQALPPAAGPPDGPYEPIHRWSIDDPHRFWRALWDFAGVLGEPGKTTVVDLDRMPGARWFPQARLNFAENLLRRTGPDPAIVFCSETRSTRRLSRDQLREQVARVAAALAAEGVKPGDRIAAWMPNLPETVIIMLAAASLGAMFSSASPDFGVSGLLDRFGQIEPVVLFAADGYFYDGKHCDCLGRLPAIVAGLPTLKRVVVTPYLGEAPDLSGIPLALSWSQFQSAGQGSPLRFEPLPFDHPLYILYSSGTTGVPKCIVHGAGGTLLQHLKEHQLHTDIRPGDRLFYFTTCGWMMWNWLASALASGATLLLYDGSPFREGGRVLFDFVEAERATHLGTSAKFLEALSKSGLRPIQHWSLPHLRTVLSTGSPLAPEGFDFVYRDIKPDIALASISGGTDIVACFVLGNPMLPVYRGEIQSKALGMAVEVFDENGKPLSSGKGDLVCTRPFPSMPLGFWNDPEGTAYRAAYFDRFPGVWRHGDYAEWTPHGGMIIHGRSDATLNPGGVRIGTAEIYRQVERLPEVLEALAVGQEWKGDIRVILFVRLRPGNSLDTQLAARIRETIRLNLSPRHVPARIVAVDDIPRTRSGKIIELAVRDVIHGRPVKNLEALANPAALDGFRDLKELSD